MGGACRGKAEDEGVEMKVKVDCSRERGRNHLDLVIAVKWTTCADLSLLIPCPFYPPPRAFSSSPEFQSVHALVRHLSFLSFLSTLSLSSTPDPASFHV